MNKASTNFTIFVLFCSAGNIFFLYFLHLFCVSVSVEKKEAAWPLAKTIPLPWEQCSHPPLPPGHRHTHQILEKQARCPVHGWRHRGPASDRTTVREPGIFGSGLSLRIWGFRFCGVHSGGLGVQGSRGLFTGTVGGRCWVS